MTGATLRPPVLDRIPRVFLDWGGLGIIVLAGIMIGRLTPQILHSPPRLHVLALALLLIPFLFFVRWTKLVLFTLFWIVFEALLRRYVVNDIMAFFIKDLFLAFAYFKTIGVRFTRGFRSIPSTPVNLLLAILLVWSVVELFNPLLLNYLVGVLGLRLSFFYVPIMFIAGDCFPTKQSLFRFLKAYVLLGAAVCAYGFIQWMLGPGSILSKTYLDMDAFYATPSGTVIFRSMGTFASNAAFSEWVLFVMLFAVICAKVKLPAGRLTKVQKVVVGTAIVLAMIATGQAALGVLIVFTLFLTWLADVRSRRGVSQLITLAVGVMIITALVWTVAPLVTTAWTRVLMFADPRMLIHRLFIHVFEPIPRALGDSFFGHGVGSQAQGLRYLVGVKEAASLSRVEGGYAKLAWELGIVGLVLVPALHLVLLRWALNIRRGLRDPDLRWVAFIGAILQACLLLWMFISNSLDHSTFAILFWTTVGIVSALPRLEAKAAATSA